MLVLLLWTVFACLVILENLRAFSRFENFVEKVKYSRI